MKFDGMGIDRPIKFGKYKHYKGKYYEVFGVAHQTETREKLVIYRGLYESPDLEREFGPDPWFARPYEMFVGEQEVDGVMVKRFLYVGSM